MIEAGVEIANVADIVPVVLAIVVEVDELHSVIFYKFAE